MERKRSTTTKLVSQKTHVCFSFYFFMLSICFLIFSCTTASAITCLDTRCPMSSKSEIDFQEEMGQGMMSQGKTTEVSMSWPRRLLGGPGSSPPHCNAKCGKCKPCRPVHVPVPPGTPVTAEYYPEAWRCKCGNKLYMP